MEPSDSRSNDALLAKNKLFAQQVEKLTKQVAKLPQQLREMQESPSNQIQQVSCCKLCKGDHKTEFCPPVEEEVNYMGNQDQGYQQRQSYQNNQGYQQRGNQGYQQGWRQDANT